MIFVLAVCGFIFAYASVINNATAPFSARLLSLHSILTALITVEHRVDCIPSPYLDDTGIFFFVTVSNGLGRLLPKLNKLLALLIVISFLRF